jgi:hypothetical protein
VSHPTVIIVLTRRLGVTASTHEPTKVLIHIDRHEYHVAADQMTGTQLRAVPPAPIGSERDLWLEVPGAHDELVANDELVVLKNGMHFFTAPATITPGLNAPRA